VDGSGSPESLTVANLTLTGSATAVSAAVVAGTDTTLDPNNVGAALTTAGGGATGAETVTADGFNTVTIALDSDQGANTVTSSFGVYAAASGNGIANGTSIAGQFATGINADSASIAAVATGALTLTLDTINPAVDIQVGDITDSDATNFTFAVAANATSTADTADATITSNTSGTIVRSDGNNVLDYC